MQDMSILPWQMAQVLSATKARAWKCWGRGSEEFIYLYTHTYIYCVDSIFCLFIIIIDYYCYILVLLLSVFLISLLFYIIFILIKYYYWYFFYVLYIIL